LGIQRGLPYTRVALKIVSISAFGVNKNSKGDNNVGNSLESCH